MFAIAIDGPSGAGKSTIAKTVAKEMGIIYMDTGALYRAVGLYMLRCKINILDEKEVSENLNFIKIELKYIDGIQHIILNGEDASNEIRKNEVSMAASNVSAFMSVRNFLLGLQRNIAKTNNIVMDGRDIGTVVLPDAQVKIFLTASSEYRAQRRVRQLEEQGQKVDYNVILAQIKERDYNDSHREHCTLKQAEDAILVDNTEQSFAQTFSIIMDIISDALKKMGISSIKQLAEG